MNIKWFFEKMQKSIFYWTLYNRIYLFLLVKITYKYLIINSEIALDNKCLWWELLSNLVHFLQISSNKSNFCTVVEIVVCQGTSNTGRSTSNNNFLIKEVIWFLRFLTLLLLIIILLLVLLHAAVAGWRILVWWHVVRIVGLHFCFCVLFN